MKFHSTVKLPEFPASALRAMSVWVARQVGISTRKVRGIEFRMSRRKNGSVSGLYYWRDQKITMRIGQNPRTEDGFLRVHRMSRFLPEERRIEAGWESIVLIVAHEFAHAADYAECGKTNERSADMRMWRVFDHFLAQKDALIAQWMTESIWGKKVEEPLIPLRVKREERMIDLLAQWRKRSKFAQTKVKKYEKIVRRYERLAARRTDDSAEG